MTYCLGYGLTLLQDEKSLALLASETRPIQATVLQ